MVKRRSATAIWLRTSLLAVGLTAAVVQAGRAEEADLTSAVLLLSEAPRMLQEACPKLGGAGADCRIEKVTVTQQGADWFGRAETRIYHSDGRETDMVMTTRLDSASCRLVDRKVVPDVATGRRLLTMTERQLRLAIGDPQSMQRFCSITGSLLGSMTPPPCLCP